MSKLTESGLIRTSLLGEVTVIAINETYATSTAASTAQSTANSASTAASTASTAASTASTAASDAQSTANLASTAASDAQSTANLASTAASDAQDTANLASTAASDAQDTADLASTAASDAQDTADLASTAASTASTAASDAQGTANLASTAASDAQDTADLASTAASDAQDTADLASTAASDAQDTANSATKPVTSRPTMSGQIAQIGYTRVKEIGEFETTYGATYFSNQYNDTNISQGVWLITSRGIFVTHKFETHDVVTAGTVKIEHKNGDEQFNELYYGGLISEHTAITTIIINPTCTFYATGNNSKLKISLKCMAAQHHYAKMSGSINLTRIA